MRTSAGRPQVNVRLDPEEITQLKAEAEARGLTVSEVVREQLQPLLRQPPAEVAS